MISAVMKSIVDDETGATAIEYGLIVALIAIAIVGSLTAVAGETGELWNNNERGVTKAIGSGPITPAED
jgi:pilus assembly protein Flp/PilA